MSMTENEAKGVIPYMKNSTHTETCEKCLYIKSRCKCNKSDSNAGCIGIKEAQEYLLNRYLVVGSPANPPKEECEKHNAVMDMAIQALSEIQQYRAIGTVEEIKAAMKYMQIAKMHGTVGKAIDACAEYETIGTIEELKALKEKAEAKKPILNNPKIDEFYVKEAKLCPLCHGYINDCSGDYCRDCGQRIDWNK